MRTQAAEDAASKSRQSSWSSALWGIPANLVTGGGSEMLKGLIKKWMTPTAKPTVLRPEAEPDWSNYND
jgi:hypothetical protein